MLSKLILTTALLAPLAVAANALPSAPYLPLNLATKAAQATVDACSNQRHNVSVAVVVRDREPKVQPKAANRSSHKGNSAPATACTCAAMERDTAGLAGFIANNPANDGLRSMDSRMVIQGGGLPIRIGDALVGGIGVGGAPTGDIDAECATAGLKAIG